MSSDAYMPSPECPECSKTIEEGDRTCPHCDAELISCERGGHIVTKAEYKAEVGMCYDCWDITVGD